MKAVLVQGTSQAFVRVGKKKENSPTELLFFRSIFLWSGESSFVWGFFFSLLSYILPDFFFFDCRKYFQSGIIFNYFIKLS